ncbi:glycerophosphodiester phosphodiesterase family protein [Olivibacter ginsenosidimutans]|uniref:Glycerophosphodiester phosphodiesterase family protein n=1 Tax=Olivibacter ginsenosidimutans TaxID=1176537 RepID=A0ABP9AFX8_9SPHI
MAQTQSFDKQAHRGGRGLMPENTLAAMKNALDLGTTVELDLYFSKDQQIIVSHDAYISSVFAQDAKGRAVKKEDEARLKLNRLNYREIKQYDVGLRPHPEFPQQKKIAAYIPLFAELIDSVEAYAKAKALPAPHYNIEAKVPSPAKEATNAFRENFIKAMMKIILKKGIQARVMIQSFDPGMLEIVHRDYAKQVETSYLVSRGDLTSNLQKLSFVPDIYSPYYPLVTPELVKQCHEQHIRIIPWTVNTKAAIEKLRAMDVDGIISDYPNLF